MNYGIYPGIEPRPKMYPLGLDFRIQNGKRYDISPGDAGKAIVRTLPSDATLGGLVSVAGEWYLPEPDTVPNGTFFHLLVLAQARVKVIYNSRFYVAGRGWSPETIGGTGSGVAYLYGPAGFVTITAHNLVSKSQMSTIPSDSLAHWMATGTGLYWERG